MQCAACSHDIPLNLNQCPHCAQPGLFPNVRAAAQPEERAALEQRYQQAIAEAAARGEAAAVQEFQDALGDSRAVIARPLGEVERLAVSDRQGYASYYQLVDAEVRLPDGDEWEILRRLADEAFFPGYREHIRFAALTLDGIGLSNYGDCSIVLRTAMIAHRASAFEENTAVFVKRHEVKIKDAAQRARGRRATWDDRGKLCVAKLSASIRPGSPRDSYPGILLRQGATSASDDFVEVHIYGPMTSRTIEQVIMTGPKRKRPTRARLAKLKEQLGKVGVTLEEQA